MLMVPPGLKPADRLLVTMPYGKKPDDFELTGNFHPGATVSSAEKGWTYGIMKVAYDTQPAHPHLKMVPQSAPDTCEPDGRTVPQNLYFKTAEYKKEERKKRKSL